MAAKEVTPLALGLLALAACSGEDATEPSAHPAALLPESSVAAAGWNTAVDAGAVAILEQVLALPTHRVSALSSETGAFGVRILDNGGRVFLDPMPPATSKGHLGARRWFRDALTGLDGPGPGLTLAVDLRRLRKAPGFGELLARVPGVASFLAGALWLGPAAQDADANDIGRDVRLFIKLARTPVGIARTLDIEPAKLRLLRLFLPLETGASWLAFRADPTAVLNAFQAMLAGMGLGAFGPGPADVMRGLQGSFLFRRDLWEAAGSEAAIVLLEEERSPFVLVATENRAALLDVARELTVSAGRIRIALDEDGAAPIARVRAFRLRMIAVYGERFVAIGRERDEEQLLALVERERGRRPATLPFAAPDRLNAAGDWSFQGRRLRFWMTRTGGGLFANGTLR